MSLYVYISLFFSSTYNGNPISEGLALYGATNQLAQRLSLMPFLWLCRSLSDQSDYKLEIPPLITEDTPADFEELTVIVFESEALCHNMLQRLETNTKNICETKEILKETSEQISNMKTSSNVTNQKENSNRRYAVKTTGKFRNGWDKNNEYYERNYNEDPFRNRKRSRTTLLRVAKAF
ncbi:hypothetical protein Zmor_026679 [Zophobas morio]|uniref:Uncharacterized protein n=1 Tax=Zophobas morio TaxID=2755281 RepID=A0AA38M653_9CUCU|nr:hypothetical protein Zmor_026679 [Zophobas morio]